jgi:two-component system chemotaxis response regulator CheB
MSLAPKLTEAASGPTGQRRALRVVVLDDDAVFRTVLSRMLTNIGLEVVATCGDIDSAKRRVNAGGVDAVTVDVVLRNESGLDFLKWCHAKNRTILTVLVTAGTAKGARTGVDAIFLGAAALLTKPTATQIQGFEIELRRVFSDGKQSTGFAARRPPPPTPTTFGGALKPAVRKDLLAIGTSTGGPPVLLKILKGLPASFDVPIVITQHMPAMHMQYLAELLASQSGRRVTVASDGTAVQKGHAYLAGHGKHLVVERRGDLLVLKHFDGPPEHFCKPAVDPMFRSIAKTCHGTVLGVVATGMGADGALGAVAMRASGNPVVIQDQETSVVWGMPGAVAAAQAADAVYSADQLSFGILNWMGKNQTGGLVR